jgi:hypothetical protein
LVSLQFGARHNTLPILVPLGNYKQILGIGYSLD